MADRYLIPLPGGQWLALEPEAFREGLKAGRDLFAQPAKSLASEQWLDPDQLAAALHLPVSRVAAMARRGTIPATKFGRRWRFKLSMVEAAVHAAHEH